MIACAKCGTHTKVDAEDMLCVKCRGLPGDPRCGCGKPLAGHRTIYEHCPDQPESEARKPLDLTAAARLKGMD